MDSSKIVKISIKNLFRKIRMITDRLRGLDFHTIILPEEVGLDSSIVFRSSPSGDDYLMNVFKSINIQTSLFRNKK